MSDSESDSESKSKSKKIEEICFAGAANRGICYTGVLKCLEDHEFCTRIKCVSFVSPAYTDRLGGTKLTKDGSSLLDLKRITANMTNNGILSILLNTQYGFGGDNSIKLTDRNK